MSSEPGFSGISGLEQDRTWLVKHVGVLDCKPTKWQGCGQCGVLDAVLKAVLIVLFPHFTNGDAEAPHG